MDIYLNPTMRIRFLTFLLLAAAAQPAEYFLYSGSYTAGKSKGINVSRFDSATGKLEAIGLAGESPNPTFLAVHPNQRFLYTVNNLPGKPGNTVSGFAIDRKTGKLTALNQVEPGGEGPSHLTLDRTGKWLAVANYGTGSVAIMPVAADGRLGAPVSFDQQKDDADPKRLTRAHMVLFSPDNRFLIVANVALDRVYSYRFDASNGKLAANDPPFANVPPGTNPRHLALDKKNNVLYVVNERGSGVTALQYTPATGKLEPFQTVSALPSGFSGRNSGAEIALGPSGKFVYTSNRGHDSIAIFAIDPAKHTVQLIENVPTEGKTPRNFAFDPTGKWLVAGNEASDSLVVFRADPETGKLTRTGDAFNLP